MPDQDTDEVNHRPLGPFSHLICYWYGHHWVDDAFMGESQECARCDAMRRRRDTHAVPSPFWMVAAYALGIIVGMVMGGIVL